MLECLHIFNIQRLWIINLLGKLSISGEMFLLPKADMSTPPNHLDSEGLDIVTIGPILIKICPRVVSLQSHLLPKQQTRNATFVHLFREELIMRGCLAVIYIIPKKPGSGSVDINRWA